MPKIRELMHMKMFIVIAALLLMQLESTLFAQRALEGSVETRIGQLQFDKGYPTDATIEKLFDELDFQRACQAYLWGTPDGRNGRVASRS